MEYLSESVDDSWAQFEQTHLSNWWYKINDVKAEIFPPNSVSYHVIITNDVFNPSNVYIQIVVICRGDWGQLAYEVS